MKLTIQLTTQLTTGILAIATVVGGSVAMQAQSPDAIDNARSTAKSLQQTQANGSSTAPAKPAPGAPAPAVKPAAIPGSKATAKSAASASTSASNQLQKVNVLPGPDGVDIEITSSQTVTPRVSKLKSPDRVVVELPGTAIASAQNKIPVGSGGVKGVRIGMDGKTPPTTSVVIDLEKAMAYDVTPGDAGQLILTLHAQAGATAAPVVAKATPAPAKTAPAAQLKTAVAKSTPAAAKPEVTKAAVVVAKSEPIKADPMKAPSKPTAKETKTVAPAESPLDAKSDMAIAPKEPKQEDKKWAMNGKRDPFFSPVVQQNGSGCSTGKKCLEIGTINLRGVVKSDNGFIAVVTNNLNKAYFLRENDPVFNGYVVKITGDSVVFQETVQDKLGKSFTREVVKRIFTPAV
jgi:hypothetical protein